MVEESFNGETSSLKHVVLTRYEATHHDSDQAVTKNTKEILRSVFLGTVQLCQDLQPNSAVLSAVTIVPRYSA